MSSSSSHPIVIPRAGGVLPDGPGLHHGGHCAACGVHDVCDTHNGDGAQPRPLAWHSRQYGMYPVVQFSTATTDTNQS